MNCHPPSVRYLVAPILSVITWFAIHGVAFADRTITTNTSYTNNQNINGTLTINAAGNPTLTLNSGASLSNLNYLIVGRTQKGQLLVNTNVTLKSTGDALLGQEVNSTGVMTVTGAGATWTNAETVYSGYAGNGTLNILNGATASSASGVLGWYPQGVGTVNVNGVGSQWVIANDIRVADEGAGVLNVQNGGKVTSPPASSATTPAPASLR